MGRRGLLPGGQWMSAFGTTQVVSEVVAWGPSVQLSQGLSLLKASLTNLACLQVEKNTKTLAFRWVLMKPHSTLIFWLEGHSTKACCSFTGVGMLASSWMEMYSGSDKLSLARSLTDLVCVAENRRVWRPSPPRPPRGRFSRMASSVARNPMSRIRSASSSTRIFKALQSKYGVSSMC